MSSIGIDRDDISVRRIVIETCPRCGKRPLTHWVILDVRETGETFDLSGGCEACCNELAGRIRRGLPEILDGSDETGRSATFD